MILSVTLLLVLWPAIQDALPQQAQRAPEPQPIRVDPEIATQFLKVHRNCVESFGTDAASVELQAMVINALNESKKFIVMEKYDDNGRCLGADATLRGVSTQQVHQEARSSSEGTAIRHAEISESSHSTETINEARLAVRLVSNAGDVLWSSTQESKGAKYKGASADAADKVVKQLLKDREKLEKERDSDSNKKPAGAQ